MSVVRNAAAALVDLNRRVQVRRKEGQQRTVCSIDELRSHGFVVILGEPGIGKSSILAREAARLGTAVVTMRGLIEGEMPDSGHRLFVDALDEYRSGGNRAAMTTDVIKQIRAMGSSEIWLACRTEDWQPQVDDSRIPGAVSAQDAIMAEVLPLAWTESSTLLTSWGEPDAESFLGRAWNLGVSSFVENPLSLRLLQRAVRARGHWPETRFDVFSEGVRNLAQEHDPERDARFRPSDSQLRDAAAHTCLILLLTGRQAIWKPGGLPDELTKYLTADELGLEPNLLSWVLDTPLFRCAKGSSFRPMHRFVAEFLAAEALARRVRPDIGMPAFPMARALRLISADDRIAPTELRGLYAWFAAHLAQRGGFDEALQLAEADAPTVLTYGDPKVLGTSARRKLLTNLTRRDPYIFTGELGPTSITGLSGEDLAPEFKKILMAGPDGSHRAHVVLTALSHGQPILSLRPLLCDMVLDPAQPGWLRERALDAFLHSVTDRGQTCLDLLAQTESEPPTESRETIRTILVGRLNNDDLTAAVILKLLRERVRNPGDGFHGSLYSLQQRLQARPMPDLFEQALKDPQSTPDPLFQDYEATHLLDYALAACIDRCGHGDGVRIWTWARNIKEYEWEVLPEHAREACQRWIEKSPTNELALFRAALNDPSIDSGALAAQRYMTRTGLRPSLGLVRSLIEASRAVNESGQRAGSAAALAVMHCEQGSDVWEDLFVVLARAPEQVVALGILTQCHRQFMPGADELWNARTQRLSDEVSALSRDISFLSAHLDALRRGEGFTLALHDSAVQFYLEPRADDGRVGAERVRLFADGPTRDAIYAGWEYLATHGFGADIGAASMGRLEAKNSRFNVEVAALAGVDRLLEQGRLPRLAEMPIVVALALARSLHVVSEADRRERLDRLARERLDLDAEAGGELLKMYWESMADEGGLDLRPASLHTTRAGQVAIASLLEVRPDLHHPCLLSALGFAAGFMNRQEFLALASASAERHDLGARPKAVWRLIALAMDERPLCPSDLNLSVLMSQGWADRREATHILSTLTGVPRGRSRPHRGTHLCFDGASDWSRCDFRSWRLPQRGAGTRAYGFSSVARHECLLRPSYVIITRVLRLRRSISTVVVQPPTCVG